MRLPAGLFICECNEVTAETIMSCGSCDYFQVQRITKAGRKCGSCAPRVLDLLENVKLRAETGPNLIDLGDL